MPARRVFLRVVCTAVIGFLGFALRVANIRSRRGEFSADEAYVGLESMEILQGRFPVVLGDAAYTAVGEAYIYVPLLWIFGPNALVLKMLSIIFWGIACVATALIAQRLAESVDGNPERVMLLAGGSLWVASPAMIELSTRAYPSYSSGMLVIVLMVLLAQRLVDRDLISGNWFVALGSLAGLGIWMHPKFSGVIVPVLLYVIINFRTFRRAGLIAVGGLIAASPFIIWNLLNGLPSRDLPYQIPSTWFDRMSVFARLLVPRALGLRENSLYWTTERSIGLLLFFLVATLVVLGLIALRKSSRPSRWLLLAILGGSFPIMALFSPLMFASDGRYAIGPLPFIMIAMVLGIDFLVRRIKRREIQVGFVLACVAIWLGGFVLPGARPTLVRESSRPDSSAQEMAKFLQSSEVKYVLGPYWEVLPVDFFSYNKVVGAVVPPWPQRLPERQRAVEEADPDKVAILMRVGSENLNWLLLDADRYTRHQAGHLVVYLPYAGK